jgi:hypothetical protein
MAAATAAAGAFVQILGGGQASEFEGFGNLPLDGILNGVQFFLRVEKTAGHGIFQERFAAGLKIGNLRRCERLAVVLFLVERLTFAHEYFILAARAGVGHERVNAFADGEHFRLRDKGLAEFARFFFDFCRHKIYFARTINHNCRTKAILNVSAAAQFIFSSAKNNDWIYGQTV